jgi:DNA repair protein RadC
MKTLSDADLLSVLIGETNATAILQGGLSSLVTALKKLTTNPVHVLRDSASTFEAQGPLAKVAAALELATRVSLIEIAEKPLMRNPTMVKDYLIMALSKLEYEVFQVIYLDNQHCLISSEEAFRGTVNQTAVYPREIVKRALELNAAAVIVSHNHPSGNPEPSNSDHLLTKHLKDALQMVEVRFLDHIIVAGKTTLSFAERGLI